MPIRNRKGYTKSKRIKSANKNKRRSFFKRVFLFILILFVLIIYLLLKPKNWENESKLIAVYPNTNGDVVVVVLDTLQEEITKVVIPGNTEVDVARQYGRWRLKSIWELGKNEKVGGKLLTETLVKSFKIPVTTWVDEKGSGLFSGNLLGLMSAFVSKDTNLNLGDRIRIALFSFKVRGFKKEEINLKD